MYNSIEELVAVWKKKFMCIALDLPKSRGAAIRDLFKQIELLSVSVPDPGFDVLDEQIEVSIVLRKDFPNEEEVWVQMLHQILGNFRLEFMSDGRYYSALVKVLSLMKEINFKGYSRSLSSNLRRNIESFLKVGVREFGPREQVSMSLAETVCEYRLYDLFFEQPCVELEDRWIGSEPVLTMLQKQIHRMRTVKSTQEWVEEAIYDYRDREVAQAWLTHNTARKFRERSKPNK